MFYMDRLLNVAGSVVTLPVATPIYIMAHSQVTGLSLKSIYLLEPRQ